MYAIYYHGVRVSDYYQDRSKLVQSKEWKQWQNKATVEIK